MHAKLQRLALKHSTVSAISANRIHKPDYDNPPGRGGVSFPKSPQRGVGYYEPTKVSGDRNETERKVAAPNNSTYSETVHDGNTDNISFSDGRRSVFAVTERSAASEGQKTPINKTETNSILAANWHTTKSDNSTRANVTRRRRYDVKSNEIPTFPGREMPPGSKHEEIRYRPETRADNSNVNRFSNGGKEGGPRISQNERYSKVGRDPPFWVPVEPIRGEPFLREPSHKDMTYNEPYEPIPPLARNDIGIENMYRNWKPVSEASPTVNRTRTSVRQRADAKEGGASQVGGASLQLMGKIASPLEQEWIHEAEVAATAVEPSKNFTEPKPGLYRNETRTDPVRKVSRVAPLESTSKNRKDRNSQHEGDGIKSKAMVNSDNDDCATSSWKNVRFIRDPASGGWYVIQAKKTNANCSDQNEAAISEAHESVGRQMDVTPKSQHHHLTQDQSSAQVQTHGNTSRTTVSEDGWQFFGPHVKLTKDVRHQGTKNHSSDPQSDKNITQGSVSSSGQIHLQGDSSSIHHPTEDVVRYYLIGPHPQTEKGHDSRKNEELLIFNSDHVPDPAPEDPSLDHRQEGELEQVILPTNRETSDDVIWQEFPSGGDKNPLNNADDLTERGLQTPGRSDLDQQHTTGSPEGAGNAPHSTGIPQRHTTPETVRAVVPAAYQANTGSHMTSISGQSITWGKTFFLVS